MATPTIEETKETEAYGTLLTVRYEEYRAAFYRKGKAVFFWRGWKKVPFRKDGISCHIPMGKRLAMQQAARKEFFPETQQPKLFGGRR